MPALRFFLFFFCVGVLVHSAHAEWREIDDYTAEAPRLSESDSHHPLWAKQYEMLAQGGKCFAHCFAKAVSRFESVTYSRTGPTGIHFELWRHFPPGVGEVELRAQCKIDSTNATTGPGLGKSAAVGYCSAEYWMDSTYGHIKAAVSKGAANTKVEGLPKLIISTTVGLAPIIGGTLGAHVRLQWYTGSGVIRDSDRNYVADFQCPTTNFRIREKSQVSIFVWAMGNNVGAQGTGKGEVNGLAKIDYVLLTLPVCPR